MSLYHHELPQTPQGIFQIAPFQDRGAWSLGGNAKVSPGPLSFIRGYRLGDVAVACDVDDARDVHIGIEEYLADSSAVERCSWIILADEEGYRRVFHRKTHGIYKSSDVEALVSVPGLRVESRSVNAYSDTGELK